MPKFWGLLGGALVVATGGGNAQIDTFQHAKTELANLYAEHRVTLYSGCAFTAAKEVDYDRCAYRPQGKSARAQRIEWEHVVPAEAFGQSFAPWRDGDAACVDSKGRPYRGRRCAAKASSEYRHMEADRFNSPISG